MMMMITIQIFRPITPPFHDGEDKSSSTSLLKVASASESHEINANNSGSIAQPFLCKSETSTETLRAPPWEVDGKLESFHVSSTVQNTSIPNSDSEHHVEPHVYQSKFFTPNQISSAIAASEGTRIYCSLAAAIVVVLSYVGFPVLGSHIIKSVIFFRPLYLVLLTNVSIVLAQLLLGKQRGLERIEQEANNVPSSIGGFGLAEQVGKALESGLVLQNIMSAVFMDCSVYAMVIVCGLSLSQKLSW